MAASFDLERAAAIGEKLNEVDMARVFAVIATVLAWCLLSGPPVAAKRAADPFVSPEAIQHWMKNYRAQPEPHLLPAAVKAMSRLGVFREIDSAGIYFGFVAGVIGSNPRQAETLVAEMFPLPPEDQIVIVRAIAWSGLPDWQAMMSLFVEKMPARRILIERHLFGKLPGLMDLPLDDNPAGIDALWGYYYGSGSALPIKRLIATLGWSLERDEVDKLTAGNMIKLTLAVNATRDLELLAIIRRQVIHQPKATAAPLAEVIEAAETYETARLRKTALTAISDLRQKGSATKRNVSFWGQVGTTALALGCVAASVMGQVQFGLPCIVGGATATAALKVYTLDK